MQNSILVFTHMYTSFFSYFFHCEPNPLEFHANMQLCACCSVYPSCKTVLHVHMCSILVCLVTCVFSSCQKSCKVCHNDADIDDFYSSTAGVPTPTIVVRAMSINICCLGSVYLGTSWLSMAAVVDRTVLRTTTAPKPTNSVSSATGSSHRMSQ